MSSDPRWLLMKEIYFAAQSLPTEAQAKYLKDHCPDEAMRKDVERLLGESTESITHVTLDSLVPPGPSTQSEPALGPGSLLGHYRIKRRLGTGGMSWVFEANDEKLLRTVAIKVLPPGRDDEPMRRRLMREAQSASALNHPNIVTVYEVGRYGDTDFIAMERIQGNTLREIAGHNGLDAKTALRYAVQIADALAAAHDAKIVHRDLKPSNIMVTERGLVKVLDFGIAKQIDRIASAASSSDISISRSGEVIGTLSYMSPEQAQGHAVDARSDIFSFGSLLYEMLSGRRAFLAETGLDTIAAVVSKDPTPLHELLPSLSRGLERVVTKCLQKKPIERWQHMSDVKQILQDLLRDFDLPAEEAPISLRGRRGLAIGAIALAAGALAFVAATYFTRTAAEPQSVLRRVTSDAGLNTTPALSKDGKLLAYASDRANQGNLDIWIQQVGGGEPIRLTSGPADETDPAFSPDGTQVVYRSESGIFSVPTLGGEPSRLAREGRGPRFSPDGRSIAFWTGDGIFVIDSWGGTARRIYPDMASARSPIWSPKGDALLVYGRKYEKVDWWVLPINGSAAVETGVLGNIVDWREEGVLYAMNSGDATNLWEIPMSSSHTAQPPARRLTQGPGSHRRASAIAGAITFSDEIETASIWEIYGKGEPRRVASGFAPSLSGDGRQLTFIRRTFGNSSVMARDLDANRERGITTSPLLLPSAHVTADFRQLLFTTGRYDLSSMPTAGGSPEIMCAACGTVTGVSADGSQILYQARSAAALLLFDTVAKKTITLSEPPQSDSTISSAHFSPDGHWIAFVFAGRAYTIPLDKNRVTPFADWISISEDSHSAFDPAWAPSGDLMYFTSERDGFRCIWARRLDPITKKPTGESYPVRHFHSARYSLGHGLAAAADRIAFTVNETTGNIWLEVRAPAP